MSTGRGLKDTSETMLDRFQTMIMERNPVERLLMGFSMYDTAKQIVKCGILDQHPDISSHDLKKDIFLAFYGNDFCHTEKKRIVRSLFDSSD